MYIWVFSVYLNVSHLEFGITPIIACGLINTSKKYPIRSIYAKCQACMKFWSVSIDIWAFSVHLDVGHLVFGATAMILHGVIYNIEKYAIRIIDAKFHGSM